MQERLLTITLTEKQWHMFRNALVYRRGQVEAVSLSRHRKETKLWLENSSAALVLFDEQLVKERKE